MLNYFFTFRDDIPKSMQGSLFSTGHILTLLVIVLLWAFLIRLFKGKSQDQKWRFLIIMCFLLPILELSRIIWVVSLGKFSWGEFLPLHLCGLMAIIYPVMAATKSRFLQQYAYAVGLAPALIALLTPDVSVYPTLSFQFLQSMLVHGIICFIPLFLVFDLELFPDIRQLPKIIGLVALFSLVMVPINLITKGNYFFLCQAPAGTPIEIFEKMVGWPWYILPTFILGCVLWLLAYLPFLLRKPVHRSKDTLP